MDDIDDDIYISDTEQLFHNTIRENIIFLLLFLLLYLGSFAFVQQFRRHDKDDLYSTDDDEILVYRISLWLCTFSLAIAIGAALLLPISIASNEVLLLYPNSYYVKWLNSSLIHGLWNYIFLFSNVSLFILLPFSYLFAESTGFYGYRKGLISRVYETFTVFSLLAVIVFGLTYLLSTVFDPEKSEIQTILNLGSYHLPFLYSCIAFLGVILLLVCTPLGFIHLFHIVDQILVKPHLLRDIREELRVSNFEEACIKRKLAKYNIYDDINNSNSNNNKNNSNSNSNNSNKQLYNKNNKYQFNKLYNKNNDINNVIENFDNNVDNSINNNVSNDNNNINNQDTTTNNNNNNNSSNNSNNSDDDTINTNSNDSYENYEIKILKLNLNKLIKERRELLKLNSSSSFQRNIVYPLAMLILLLLTILTIVIVFQNTLEILIGIKSLPLSVLQQPTKFTLGIMSLSKLGPIGATIEIFIILYLGATSLVGLYTIPIVQCVQPKLQKTSLTKLIINCTLVLILSSALPLLSRILGITNFDLLGDFGAIEWLGNFQIVFIYNLIFGATTTLCLTNKFTSSVWSFW